MKDEYVQDSGDLPVFDFPVHLADPKNAGVTGFDHPEVESVAWRIGLQWDSVTGWADTFARFCQLVDTTRVRAFVVGPWWDPDEGGYVSVEPVIEELVAARDRFPALRSLFLGDIVAEDCEISWITQGRVTDLLAAYPELTELTVRGSDELRFPAVRHERLEKLTMQSGGLPAEVVRGIAAGDFPALTHLDLWLGTPNYGGDAEIADLAPILTGERLPSLRHLALHNSEIQDEICAALATAPVVARLETLDVSMGVLTDLGAAALLGGQPLTHLRALDMHYHYLSPEMCARLREALEPAVRLELYSDGAQAYTHGDEVWRFVAVGE